MKTLLSFKRSCSSCLLPYFHSNLANSHYSRLFKVVFLILNTDARQKQLQNAFWYPTTTHSFLCVHSTKYERQTHSRGLCFSPQFVSSFQLLNVFSWNFVYGSTLNCKTNFSWCLSANNGPYVTTFVPYWNPSEPSQSCNVREIQGHYFILPPIAIHFLTGRLYRNQNSTNQLNTTPRIVDSMFQSLSGLCVTHSNESSMTYLVKKKRTIYKCNRFSYRLQDMKKIHW